MDFFGKKRPKQESNLNLPEISPNKNVSDDIKFPEFPTYESATELNAMKAREQEFRSTLNKPIAQEIPKRKFTDNLVAQGKPRFQTPQPSENLSFIPLRPKQYRPIEQDQEFTQLDINQSPNFGLDNVEKEELQQKPRYETDQVEGPYQPSKPIIQDTFRSSISQEKPIFIKLENYKDVFSSLESIRKKIRDAESMLDNLNRLKAEEERALESWKSQVESLKNKLLDIDKKLFE